ncbi:MAG: hypothetical protein RLZZ444_1078 [Pseudomonadota bacterium]|jgi:hypothetical protein
METFKLQVPAGYLTGWDGFMLPVGDERSGADFVVVAQSKEAAIEALNEFAGDRASQGRDEDFPTAVGLKKVDNEWEAERLAVRLGADLGSIEIISIAIKRVGDREIATLRIVVSEGERSRVIYVNRPDERLENGLDWLWRERTLARNIMDLF